MTADQPEQWRKAIADNKRQQRNRRGRRKRGLDAVTGPGMVRVPATPQASDLRKPGGLGADARSFSRLTPASEDTHT
jgi:hypothetical protein